MRIARPAPALALALAAAAACKVQDSALDAIFSCDPKAAVDQCGATREGRPMVCYTGSQLGGTDFCAEACDARAPPQRPGFTCLTSGALLQVCKPHAGQSDPAVACPPGLHCYRTDLLDDQGVCLMMPVCTVDSDCKDPSRSKCAATLVRQISPLLSGADALQCIKPTCQSTTSDCAANEACLADYFYTGTSIPDICVPSCDGQRHCPPNFACAESPSSPGAPRVCLPGLPGQRCQADQDCIIGVCQDTGAGFSQCVLPISCTTDASCQFLEASAFVCVEGVPGRGRYCVAITPFYGSNCDNDSGCAGDQKCYWYSPFEGAQRHGECRVPCDSDLHCAPRGGIPHVCLDEGRGGCYPGIHSLPCTPGRSECVSDLTCLPAGLDSRSIITSPNICTTPCETDADCTSHPLIRRYGFCKEGLCRFGGSTGEVCSRDGECVSGTCVLAGATEGQCV